METYNKPSLTLTQQVKLLESRGLVVTDKKRAIRHLSNISYYRLSAYMLPYKKKQDNKSIFKQPSESHSHIGDSVAYKWNRDFSIVPEKLRFTKRLVWISNPDSVQRSKLYYFICMLNYMLQVSNPTSTFKHRIRNLIEEYHDIVKTSAMGFPEYWAEEQMWK